MYSQRFYDFSMPLYKPCTVDDSLPISQVKDKRLLLCQSRKVGLRYVPLIPVCATARLVPAGR